MRRLEDALAGRSRPDDFAPSVWDEWNAKSTRAKADDALVADEGLLEALESVSEADRARLTFPFGPLTVGFDQVVGLRLNEHAFHTWDIEVVFDDDARLPTDAAAVVVDNLELIARFTARPTGEERTVRVRTTDPAATSPCTSRPTAELTAAGRAGGSPTWCCRPRRCAGSSTAGSTRTTRRSSPATPRCSTTLRAVFPGP